MTTQLIPLSKTPLARLRADDSSQALKAGNARPRIHDSGPGADAITTRPIPLPKTRTPDSGQVPAR